MGRKIADDVNEDVSALVGVAPSRELPDPGLQLRRIQFPVYRNSAQSELKAVGANSGDWRSSAYNDLRPPVWLGRAQAPFSPL